MITLDLTPEQLANLRRILWATVIDHTHGADNVDPQATCNNPNRLAWNMTDDVYRFLVASMGRGYALTTEDFRRMMVLTRQAINPNHKWNGFATPPCRVDRFKAPNVALDLYHKLLKSGTLSFGG